MPTVERSGQYLQTIFRILQEVEGSLPAATVLAELEKRLGVLPEEAQDYPSTPGVRRFEKLVRFSTIPAVKAGWLDKKRGEWTLTESGAQALDQYPDPVDLAQASRRAYREWHLENHADLSDTAAYEADREAEDSVEVTLEESEEAAWRKVLEHLAAMDPFHFQDLCAALLEAMGYHVTWRAPKNRADQGVDLIAHSDPLGTTTPRIKVQVKRRADRVGHEELRAFLANLGGNDVGIYIALGGFTRDADDLARLQENRVVTLVDAQRLFDLWISHLDTLTEEGARLLPLRTVYHLAPDQ